MFVLQIIEFLSKSVIFINKNYISKGMIKCKDYLNKDLILFVLLKTSYRPRTDFMIF